MPAWLWSKLREHLATTATHPEILGFNTTAQGNAFVDLVRDGEFESIFFHGSTST